MALAPFKNTDRLILDPAPNGGWVVSARQTDRPDYMPSMLAAYTNGDDLLADLTIALSSHSAREVI